MTSTTTKPDSSQPAAEMAVDLFDNWFDPIEIEVRARAREFIEAMIRGELDTVLARPRYRRSQIAGNEAGAGIAGHRHGSRTRSLTGTFGPIEIALLLFDLGVQSAGPLEILPSSRRVPLGPWVPYGLKNSVGPMRPKMTLQAARGQSGKGILCF